MYKLRRRLPVAIPCRWRHQYIVIYNSIFICSSFTCFRIQLYFNFMCFVHCFTINCSVTLISDWLFIHTRNHFSESWNFISYSSFLSQISSETTSLIAMYSDSQLDFTIFDCTLFFHDTAHPFSKQMYPVLDLLFSSVFHVLFVYPIKLFLVSFISSLFLGLNFNDLSFVVYRYLITLIPALQCASCEQWTVENSR